jgi:tyrosine-protein kinase Etk/Wzc
MELETTKFSRQSALEEAQRLKAQLQASSGAQGRQVATEVLLFLSSHQVTAAPVLQAERSGLLAELDAMEQNYAKNHPSVTRVREKLAGVEEKIVTTLDSFIADTKESIAGNRHQVLQHEEKLQNLPSKELHLTKVQRQYQIASEIHSNVLSRYNQTKIANAVEVADVFVMDRAVVPEAPPDSVNMLLRLLMGLAFGLVASVGPVVVYDLFDKTARTEEEVMHLLALPVLECIPDIHVEKPRKHTRSSDGKLQREIDPKLVTLDFSPAFVSELHRSLRAKLMLRLGNEQKKSFTVTSFGMSEGKSLLSANIAISMAQQQLKTVLIDGDLRRGVLHNTFVLKKKPGLADLLFSESPVDDESVDGLLQQTHVPNLSLISTGPNVPNPAELLASPRLGLLRDILDRRFDVIIFDTPPLGVAADAATVKDIFQHYLVVIKAGNTNLMQLRKKLREYPGVWDKILGVVLNGAPMDRKLRYYRYSNYHY